MNRNNSSCKMLDKVGDHFKIIYLFIILLCYAVMQYCELIGSLAVHTREHAGHTHLEFIRFTFFYLSVYIQYTFTFVYAHLLLSLTFSTEVKNMGVLKYNISKTYFTNIYPGLYCTVFCKMSKCISIYIC